MADFTTITQETAAAALPKRREDGHKGDFGKLLIVGGAVGYTGAPYLAASAAVRSGCGLVYLGVPEAIWSVEATKCVSAMPFPLPDRCGMLAAEAIHGIKNRLETCDVLALGPGLGRCEDTVQLVHTLLAETDKPVVLDADGLNALSECVGTLDARAERTTVLTPHLAEFARLCGLSVSELLRGDVAHTAHFFALRHRCILVLKGHRTLITLPDGSQTENTTGGSALSKGGSGDVLTGLIASLLAQGASGADAARCGVWLHGKAADLLSERSSAYCITPEDVVRWGFPEAFRVLEQAK